MRRMVEFQRTEDLASWWGRRVRRGVTDWERPSTAITASTAYGVQQRMKEKASRRTCRHSLNPFKEIEEIYTNYEPLSLFFSAFEPRISLYLHFVLIEQPKKTDNISDGKNKKNGNDVEIV